MVDFQSRDTKRGLTDEEDDEDETDADAETESGTQAESESDPASTAETGTEPEGTDRQSRAVTEEYGPEAVTYAVATVAAGRSIDEDTTGEVAVDAIAETGDAVVTRELLAPSYDGVQTAIAGLVDRDDVDAVVTFGGTGVSPSDVTVDAVEDLMDKHLPGFGELFRVLSHEQDGTAVVRTRATAGVVDDVPVFCLPDDPTAARRGLERIVLEEADALVSEASASDDPA